MLGVPSFVVTLGGLMSFRGAAFLVADGKTQPVNDEFFQRLGGGYDGGIGVAATWALTALVIAGLFVRLAHERRSRRRHEMPLEPLWLDLAVMALPCVVLIAFAWTMNSYQISAKAEPQGIPIPVLIWAVVACVLSFIVHRTRFGRYVFAMGGNPDAAALVGIPVRRVTLLLFALLGVAGHGRGDRLDRAAECRHQFARHRDGALCNRGRGDRRHGALGRQRLDPRLGARRADHAVARQRDAAARRCRSASGW